MKSRVTIVVTLISLVVLALLFTYNCSRIANEVNEELIGDLSVVCKITGDIGRNDSLQARAQIIGSVDMNPDTVRALYDAGGSAVYTSDEAYSHLDAAQLCETTAGEVVVCNLNNPEGKASIYAIYRYDDGALLLFARQREGILSVLGHNRALIAQAVLYALTIALALFSLLRVMHREKMVVQVMAALDRFSDGNFDARIENFPETDPKAAEYNAIIARIQDRIFRQKSRNHVLSTVMSQMQNGIIAVDQKLNVIFINSVAKKLLGIVGNPEYRNVNEVSKDVKLDDVFTEAMRQGGVYTNEVAARTAVGRGHRPLRLYVSPMRREDDVVGALAIVEDITELRRLEQVRTDFAANVSHELKTPLTSIRGFVETLQAGAIDHPEMAHKFLNIIMMETERLTRLINDILSISKLESGNDEVATERIRLDKKACDVCEMLSIHAREKQVSINCHLNGEPVYIIGNPDRVEQLLINLTENAIKYNVPGGSVTVQVFSNDKEANVTISDTGIGIAEENLPRLFERFYRVDKGRSRQMGGTGLGLAIVKHIVRSMNGEIEVHSKLGEGTEFLITLPLAPRENPDKETIFDEM
ncbi:MAG: PAS domain S-box protein [Clostridia bacterium]|nr:PAS domain S-box protein [Clostridia bacterium]